MCNHLIAAIYVEYFGCIESGYMKVDDIVNFSELIRFLADNIEQAYYKFCSEDCEGMTFYDYCVNGKTFRKMIFARYVEIFNFCPNCGKALNWSKIGNKLNQILDKKIKEKSLLPIIKKEPCPNEIRSEPLYPRKGYVYLVKIDNYYKIGRTYDFSKRIKQYTEIPYEVQEICKYKVADCVEIETFLLKRYKGKKFKGEWYTLDEEDVEWIKNYLKENELKED